MEQLAEKGRAIQAVDFELDDAAEFFPPVSSDMIDGLVGQYKDMRARIEGIARMVDGEMAAAMSYFFAGNQDPTRGGGCQTVSNIFQVAGAIRSLNSAYWSKTLALTDVLDCMPQKRRDFWHAQISGKEAIGSGYNAEKVPPLPDFEDATVRATLADLLAMRATFFSERVDGIFRALSSDHVTNCPQGFSKRMILNYVYTSYANHTQVGHINDLRCIIAKFMGREEPKWNASDSIVEIARKRHGEWVTVDGGAMRIRVYLKGTAHLEIHPDMACRLNQVLAHMHPHAIPAEFRTRQKKAPKEFQVIGRPLPFAVLYLLRGLRDVSEPIGNGYPQRYRSVLNARSFNWSGDDKAIRREAERVLESIGGVRVLHYFQFDYNPDEVIDDIVSSGCIPDRVSHQFYPTPETVSRVAADMADICEYDTVLEPSAGQGDLAAFLPKDRTTCVEISPLHCSILKARGFNTIEADFIAWAATAPKFDRIVMNPPFSERRAVAHLEAAAALVNPGGRLICIMPASFKGKDVLPGWDLEWSRVFSNEFDGTGVSVAIVRADRQKGSQS